MENLLRYMGLLLGGTAFYKYETKIIDITQYEIINPKIPREFNNFKIVNISDLHNKSFGKNNKRLLDKIDNLKPDIVVITGDLVDSISKDADIALSLVKELVKKYKVYYTIGNHEQKVLKGEYRKTYLEYFDELMKTGIINLENSHMKIERNNSYINIYGVEIPLDYYPYLLKNPKSRKVKLEENFLDKNLGKINEYEYNILLAHNPFFFEEYSRWGSDLALSGHVHGGIVRIPGVGGLLSPNREFFPKYDWGKYELNNSTMILSRGLGGSSLGIRIFCKPELVSIVLKNI